MNLKFWQKAVTPEPEAPKETKSVILGLNDSLSQLLNFGRRGAETAANALNLYNESSAVSIPINKITEAFAGIEPVLVDEKGEIINDHEVLELLKQPSPFFDTHLFRQTIARDYLITNEIMLVALGNVNRPPLELQPVSPRNITDSEGNGGVVQNFIISGNTLTGEYKLELTTDRARYFDGALRELKQIRGYSTRNNSLLRGQSPLSSAAFEARQHILGNEHNIKILEKGGRLSLVFHFEEDLAEDDFEEVKQRIRAQYGGTGGESIGVTSGGKMNIDELGVNNKDMDFAKLQRMAMDAVALVYQVPLPLISNTAATFNNYKEAKTALYDDAVLPLFNRVYGGAGNFLLPRYGLDPRKYRLTYDPLSIPALRARVLDELKTRKDINIESDNELRNAIALEPVEGGDVILKPANLIPLNTAIELDEPVVARDKPKEEE